MTGFVRPVSVGAATAMLGAVRPASVGIAAAVMALAMAVGFISLMAMTAAFVTVSFTVFAVTVNVLFAVATVGVTVPVVVFTVAVSLAGGGAFLGGHGGVCRTPFTACGVEGTVTGTAGAESVEVCLIISVFVVIHMSPFLK